MGEPSESSDAGRSETQAHGKGKALDLRLKGILDSIGEGFFSLDKDLVITYFNPAAEELLGRKAGDVIGRRIFEEAFSQAKGSIFEQKYTEALRTGRRIRFETHFGVAPYENWYDVRVLPFEGGIGVLFQVTTEQRRSIEALEAGQVRFRELFDNMGSGVAIYEASADGRSFFFRDMNPAGERITGVSKDQAVGRNVEEVFPGVEKMGVLGLLRRVWRTGRAESLPTTVYEDDRTPQLWMENYAFKIGSGEVVAIFKDYTAERRALEEVRSLARFLAENPDPVMRVARDGVLLYANECSRALLENWRVAVGQAVPERIWQQWRPVIESGRPARVQVACGKRTFSLNVAPIAEAGYANVYGRDITDVLAAAREHDRVQEQLRQSQKMESIGRLAGGVAHDLNNLLTPILGYSQLALSAMGKDEPLYNDMEQIYLAGQRAQGLTRQLLAFGRKQLLDLSVLNLTDEIRQFEPILRRVIRQDIEIEFHLAEPPGSIRADPVQIHQILMNLAMNAQDAMPDGGLLTIESADVAFDEAHARTHPNIQPGPYVMLAVSDTGIGMDEKTKQQIFEPFFTTKPPGKGTGLGLATVYGIVLQHKGGIWFYSEPGRGATFKVYLPRVEAPAEQPSRPQAPQAEHKGETVLVVEDEKIVRALTCEVLQRHGYKVLTAANCDQAIDIADRYDGDIHLLVTDVVMPRLNGRELFDRLRQGRPRLAVLYMSGYTDNVIAHHGVLEEGTAFIQKPFSILGLTDKVRGVLDEAAG
jgi:PAS domain S-box-containing protein